MLADFLAAAAIHDDDLVAAVTGVVWSANPGWPTFARSDDAGFPTPEEEWAFANVFNAAVDEQARRDHDLNALTF